VNDEPSIPSIDSGITGCGKEKKQWIQYRLTIQGEKMLVALSNDKAVLGTSSINVGEKTVLSRPSRETHDLHT
jgi:hypothetical protein